MSEKIYSCLLRLFPSAFRRLYEKEAQQLLRDRLRDERGFFRRMRLSFDLIVDMIRALPQAYKNSYAEVAAIASIPRHRDPIPSFKPIQNEPIRRESFVAAGVLTLTALVTFGYVIELPIQYSEAQPSGPKTSIETVLERLNESTSQNPVELFADPTAVFAQAVSSTAAEPLTSADGKPLIFDVVSIREEKSAWGPQSPVQVESTPDSYRMKGVPLMAVIQIAYLPSQGALHFGPNQIVGLPEALAPVRYNIEAKVSAADLPKWNDPAFQPAMLRTMLQAMLADRFKLVIRRETKVVPIYEMTVGRRGPKFKSSEGASLAEIQQKLPDTRALRGGAVVATGPNPGQQWLFGVTMPSLGDFLSPMAGRPIHDKTGLTGKYDLTYQLELPGSSRDGGSARPPDFFSSQILYVLQDQLGLKLSSAKGTMESLVIDHVETPSEN